jgi:hypothetical protein
MEPLVAFFLDVELTLYSELAERLLLQQITETQELDLALVAVAAVFLCWQRAPAAVALMALLLLLNTHKAHVN